LTFQFSSRLDGAHRNVCRCQKTDDERSFYHLARREQKPRFNNRGPQDRAFFKILSQPWNAIFLQRPPLASLLPHSKPARASLPQSGEALPFSDSARHFHPLPHSKPDSKPATCISLASLRARQSFTVCVMQGRPFPNFLLMSTTDGWPAACMPGLLLRAHHHNVTQERSSPSCLLMSSTT